MSEIRLVYAILASDGENSLNLTGLNGEKLFTLDYEQIAVAVSQWNNPKLEYDDENILLFETVLEEMMEKHTILPVRFGTMIMEQKLLNFLKENYSVLIENLNRINGKIELGLRVLWDIDKIKEKVRILDSDDIEKMYKIKGDSPSAGYLVEKMKAYKYQTSLEDEAQKVVEAVHGRLEKYAGESKYRTLVTEKMVLSGAYLIEKEKEGAFKEAFREIRRDNPHLQFLLTGPWPPYNFVNIVLKE